MKLFLREKKKMWKDWLSFAAEALPKLRWKMSRFGGSITLAISEASEYVTDIDAYSDTSNLCAKVILDENPKVKSKMSVSPCQPSC